MRLSVLAIVVLSGIAFHSHGQVNCEGKHKVDYHVKETTPSNFSIYLESSSLPSRVKLFLYDLHSGRVVQERTINSSLIKRQEIFLNVKPSVYVIQLKEEGCSKVQSIGGIDGIKVGIER